MLCASGDLVELCHKPKNPYDENAVAVWSERGVQLGYVCAERALLIGKRLKEDDATTVLQAMHGNEANIRIRFGGGLPTSADRVPDVPKPSLPGKCGQCSDRCTIFMRSTSEEGPEFGA